MRTGPERRILTAPVQLPYEELGPGPTGHRVHVVDYDSSTQTFYAPAELAPADPEAAGPTVPKDASILGDPGFHAQNVYGLVMRTLARFEFALGRRVSWGFEAHQLKVVPHAFEAANAFYSPDSESLLLGYFRRDDELVFTCLSHDVVVHETTHALLDGLRGRFMAPSSPDQAAFHEGYADIVALLSVFSMEEVLAELVDLAAGKGAKADPEGLIHRSKVEPKRLRESVLFGLAEEMDPGMAGARVNALRRSVLIDPDPRILDLLEYSEPHRRGEVLVAAVMRAFLDVWTRRLTALGRIQGNYLHRQRVAEEGAGVADQLLTMAIRAIDYTPPIHLTFGDFLSAILTADTEVRDVDTRYHLRDALREWFAAYGITPSSTAPGGLWTRSDLQLTREGVRFSSLQTDRTEMFRLLWANQRSLQLDPRAYTRVTSVRPSLRIGPEDGMPVHETVAECIQYVEVLASELPAYGLEKPDGMDDDCEVVLQGGSTLILDEYGMLKYEIHNRLPNPERKDSLAAAQRRLDYLWEQGYFNRGSSFAARLS
ncbi:MAG TPA: hypothetical protein VF244_02985, partial [Acidimicrobiales bacterium]